LTKLIVQTLYTKVGLLELAEDHHRTRTL